MGQAKVTIHRYRLNENTPAEQQQVEGVTLRKDWSYFERNIEKIKSYIKTKVNENGILDYEEVEKYNNEKVYYSSLESLQKPKVVYTVDLLSMMPREKLVEVARWYDITCSNKPDWWVRNKVIEEQQKYIESCTEVKDIENTNIGVADFKNPADTLRENLEDLSNNIVNES